MLNIFTLLSKQSIQGGFTSCLRFRVGLMPLLLYCLNIPEYIKLENDGIVYGKEVLLIYLNLLACNYQLNHDEDFLRWKISRLSRIRKATI